MSIDKNRVNLYFRVFESRTLKRKTGRFPIIRLMGNVVFRNNTGWCVPETAIIDTGAHTSLIPLSLWQELKYEEICEHRVQGISSNLECSIPVIIGKVWCRIIDDSGNSTPEIEMVSMLAKTDEVPLIIGFIDILSKFHVCFDFEKREAYLEG